MPCRWLPLAALLMLPAACTNYETADPRDVTSRVEIQDSKFDDRISFVGPVIVDFQGNTSTRLRGWLDKRTREVTHQAYVDIWYTTWGWRHYWTASFVGGHSVEAAEIDGEIHCTRYRHSYSLSCRRTETVGVPISDAVLRKAQASGLEFRLNAHSGHQDVVRLPGPYIRGFLARIDRLRR